MSITELHLHFLRNLEFNRLKFHPQYNLIIGPNGSGKTSLLEAFYLLGTGHSFRTRETAPLIRHGEQTLTLFARLDSSGSISLQKSCSGRTHVKLNQQSCRSSSDLAYFLPCQVFHQDIFQIIEAGPTVRRSIMDWGMFHVKHSYLSLWKEYRQVLKQRNALLRQKADVQQFVPWDKILVELAYTIDEMRRSYFSLWNEAFQFFLSQLTDIPCALQYDKGWDKRGSGKKLAVILAEQFAADVQRQYTQSGAHQADIHFSSCSLKARQVLSRGQQKIILIALKLAQAYLLEKPCIYLMDDITAELDVHHLHRLINCLIQIKGQFFITATDLTLWDAFAPDNRMTFKIEYGKLSDVSRETSLPI